MWPVAVTPIAVSSCSSTLPPSHHLHQGQIRVLFPKIFTCSRYSLSWNSSVASVSCGLIQMPCHSMMCPPELACSCFICFRPALELMLRPHRIMIILKCIMLLHISMILFTLPSLLKMPFLLCLPEEPLLIYGWHKMSTTLGSIFTWNLKGKWALVCPNEQCMYI